MKNSEIELKCPEEIKENKGVSREEKFFRFIFASSILLVATRSDYVPAEAEASRVEGGLWLIPRLANTSRRDYCGGGYSGNGSS
ncbi:MAG: hypothetical protein XD87_0171 [candidate division WS6 bacterium 36_33]|uniref:Uncharacterized protein n=1 Tax=candidate division WS6 bacterium 36_33 TaxID=1641388 RepID=A0A101GZG6_9BACT|nr:MAG: hypothetical protein XD87_0171 [candidate division WS6 bacterium 36_33]